MAIILGILLALVENLLFCLPIGFKFGFLFVVFINMLFVMLGEYILSMEHELLEKTFIASIVESIILFGITVIALIVSLPLFKAGSYKDCIEVQQFEESELANVIPNESQLNSISLMDTTSASKLGDRTVSKLGNYASQYNVGSYYTIAIKGEIKKIAPLDHVGLFTYWKNETIPGYVIVDPLTNKADVIELDKPIKYSPSAFFGSELIRHARLAYLTDYFGDISFQLDDDGNPYWTITVEEAKAGFFNRVPAGIILVNACTGEMQKYTLKKIPEWVDLALSGDTASDLYNRHGSYINGFFNFSSTGVTQTTDDYGYVVKDDDIYFYTGITSVAADESNLGFILVNSRTNEYFYYPITSGCAEEYSAMNSAEGIVQNYGYKASFPSLVLIDNEPTYVMVLKDSSHIVRKYAMVNCSDYTMVAVEDTLDMCVTGYKKLIHGESYKPDDTVKEENTDKEEDKEEIPAGSIRVKRILFINDEGKNYCYVVSTKGECFRSIEYIKYLNVFEGDILDIQSFTKVE